MSLDTSVIIVNYNGRRWLEGCLRAVLEQREVDFEVLLVDNASTDDSVSLVREKFPDVGIVMLEANAGFAAGNNAGALAAAGRHLAFLNNDTVVEAGWLAALRRPFDEGPTVGLTTSRIVYLHDPTVVDSAGDGYFRSGGAFKRLHGQPAELAGSSEEVFGACGAAFMIRRDLFGGLGGFDPDFFMVYEDVDLSYRARLRGFRCLYVADAVVRHAGSASLGVASAEAVRCGQRNLEWVYWKNTPASLLLRSLPGHALYVLAAGVGYAAHGQLHAFLAGKWAALRSWRAVLRKRREVQETRRVPSADLWRLMDRGWFRAKRLEKRFDFSR